MSQFSVDGMVHDLTEYVAVRVFIIILYVVVIVVGSFGNIVVLVAICRGKGFGTTSNIFITNLAVCDLYLLLIDAPAKLLILNFSIANNDSGKFNTVFCSFTTYITLVIGACAVLTMLSISIERYLAVCRPLKFLDWCTVERARIVVLLSWLLSAVSFIPMATMTTSRVSLLTVPFDHEPNLSLTEYDDIDVRQVCMFVNDTNRTAAALYYVYVFAVFLVVPSIFVTFSYIKIFLHLRRQPPSRSDAEKVKDERKKLSRMMLCVLVVFIVSWLPYCILCIVAAFGGTMASDNVFFAYLLTLWLIFLGSALDPYIYSYYSASFRSQLKSILCCFCARRQRGEYEVKESQQSGQAQGGAGTWTVKGLNQNSHTSQGDTSQTASVYENYYVTRGSDANASVESEVRAAVSSSDELNGPGDTRSFSHTAPALSPVSDTPPSESVDFYVRRQPSKETLV